VIPDAGVFGSESVSDSCSGVVSSVLVLAGVLEVTEIIK